MRFLTRHLQIAPEDRSAFNWAAGWFATVLSAYYIVRPVRETLGSMEGATRLKYFFLAVFLTMLVAVPAYAWLVSRFDRRKLVPLVYRFLEFNLLGFSLAMRLPDNIVARYVAPVFFVWVSVYVMFLTSLFWSVMADVFTRERGKQLFGKIAACGTGGAIASSLMVGQTATLIGPANILLASAALMEFGLSCFRRLNVTSETSSTPVPPVRESSNPFAGFLQVVRSPYLRMILLYTFATTICNTFLYMRQADMFKVHWPANDERTAMFADMDFRTLLVTALLQAAISTALIRKSVGLAMAMLPVTLTAGLTLLAETSSLSVLVILVILSRAATYGLTVPAIGVLYTVVRRDEKYKAKSIIDTLVIRGGDAFTTWSASALMAAGQTFTTLTSLVIPVAVTCGAFGVILGRRNAVAKSAQAGASSDLTDAQERPHD